MSYATRQEERSRDQKREDLLKRSGLIVNLISVYMADSANLQTETTLASEKNEIANDRSLFISNARSQLGV